MRLTSEKLECIRGGRTIFSNLSFEVQGGEALVLLGRNGAGKTSLLRVLAGYLQPAKGKINIEGGDEELSLGEMCHFVGHLNGVKSHFTVRENLDFWAQYLDTGYQDAAHLDAAERNGAFDRDGRVRAALSAFQLGALDDVPAGYLSAGQKRRLCLARLLVAERPVWLLDEPTVSLDAASVEYVAKAVNGHVSGGGIVIAATHMDLGLENARELTLGSMIGQKRGVA